MANPPARLGLGPLTGPGLTSVKSGSFPTSVTSGSFSTYQPTYATRSVFMSPVSIDIPAGRIGGSGSRWSVTLPRMGYQTTMITKLWWEIFLLPPTSALEAIADAFADTQKPNRKFSPQIFAQLATVRLMSNGDVSDFVPLSYNCKLTGTSLQGEVELLNPLPDHAFTIVISFGEDFFDLEAACRIRFQASALVGP
jgi:hypothetical protein